MKTSSENISEKINLPLIQDNEAAKQLAENNNTNVNLFLTTEHDMHAATVFFITG